MSDFDYTGELKTASMLLGESTYLSPQLVPPFTSQAVVNSYFSPGYSGNTQYFEYDLDWQIGSSSTGPSASVTYRWAIKEIGSTAAWTVFASGTTTVPTGYVAMVDKGTTTTLIKVPAKVRLTLTTTSTQTSWVRVKFETADKNGFRAVGYTSST